MDRSHQCIWINSTYACKRIFRKTPCSQSDMKSHYRLLQLPYESDNKIHHFKLLYRLERGIITDCWISTIFLVVRSGKVKCQCPLSVSDTCQPLRAYMDDLTVTTLVTGERWLLRRLRKVMTD